MISCSYPSQFTSFIILSWILFDHEFVRIKFLYILCKQRGPISYLCLPSERHKNIECKRTDPSVLIYKPWARPSAQTNPNRSTPTYPCCLELFILLPYKQGPGLPSSFNVHMTPPRLHIYKV